MQMRRPSLPPKKPLLIYPRATEVTARRKRKFGAKPRTMSLVKYCSGIPVSMSGHMSGTPSVIFSLRD